MSSVITSPGSDFEVSRSDPSAFYTDRGRLIDLLGEHIKFRGIFDKTKNGIVIVDHNGKVSDWNRSMEEITGLSAFEALDQDIWDVLFGLAPPRERTPENNAAMKKFIAGLLDPAVWKTEHVGEQREIVTPSGRKIVSLTVFGIPFRTFQCLAFIVREITREADNAELLKKSEQRYRTMVETQAGLVCRWLPDTTFTYVNLGFSALFGRSPGDLVGRSWLDSIPDEQKRDAREELERFLLDPKTRAYDRYMRTSDGTIRWFHWVDSPLFDEHGTCVEFQSIGMDVTEQKILQERLKTSETRFRLLFHSLSDGVLVSPVNPGPFIEVNDRACRLLGRTRKETLDLSWADLGTDPCRQETEGSSLESEGKVNYEAEIRTGAGSPVPVEISASVFELEGQKFVLSVVRDLTERKRLQRQILQSQSTEAVARLARGIAHDFNNLLNTIVGFSSVLLKEVDAASPFYADLLRIRSAGEEGTALTRRLLSLSRRTVVSPQKINLNNTIHDIEKVLSPFPGGEIRLSVALKENLEEIVLDPGQAEQLVLNLILNARDSIASGGTIEVRTEDVVVSARDAELSAERTPGRYVRFSVSGTGRGTDPLSPAGAASEKGDHAGLGLIIVNSVVCEAGGWIEVSSRPESGTSYQSYLPVEPHGGRTTTADTAPSSSPTVSHSPRKVLIIEDDRAIVVLLGRVMSMLKIEFVVAQTLRKAEELFKTLDFDMIFSDVVMPDGSGVDFVERMVSAGSGVRVVFTSGYLEDRSKAESIKGRGYRFVPKPYTFEELTNVMTGLPDRSGEG